ncbi:hypothetical protein GQ42DRAFT_75081 [Ramicandelaber brevisporus]|nr:hypothetical protein GQ42DRAFT_75081 [Ramicandelaber brevisporus]
MSSLTLLSLDSLSRVPMCSATTWCQSATPASYLVTLRLKSVPTLGRSQLETQSLSLQGASPCRGVRLSALALSLQLACAYSTSFQANCQLILSFCVPLTIN